MFYLSVPKTIKLKRVDGSSILSVNRFVEAICTVNLVDIRKMTVEDLDAACADKSWSEGYAWILVNPTPITPFPVRGMPGLFDISFSQD